MAKSFPQIETNVYELVPYANNSRTHTEEQIEQVVASIGEFGFTNPIIIDENKTIIAGHCRVLAASRLNLETVPCVQVDGWSEAQKKAYVIADNKLALNAGWDEDVLRLEFAELEAMDYDLDFTGFGESELEDLMPTICEPGLTDEDAVPETTTEPVTIAGDIFILGDHRVMCGDSTDAGSLSLLLENKKSDMVFTDPPYLMDFTGGIHADGSKSFNSTHGSIKNDKMSKGDGDSFLDNINQIIKDFNIGAFYITFYRLGVLQYLASMDRIGLKNRSIIIWNKGNHTLSNSDYMSMYEPMFYGWCESHKFYGGNNGRDIWDVKRTAKNDLHPTMKPIELMEKALSDGSRKGNTVLDLFLGSGSTLIACEKTGRKCCGMELDEKYCDVIIKRWQEFTGKNAVHENGKKFAELSNERGI